MRMNFMARVSWIALRVNAPKCASSSAPKPVPESLYQIQPQQDGPVTSMRVLGSQLGMMTHRAANESSSQNLPKSLGISSVRRQDRTLPTLSSNVNQRHGRPRRNRGLTRKIRRLSQPLDAGVSSQAKRGSARPRFPKYCRLGMLYTRLSNYPIIIVQDIKNVHFHQILITLKKKLLSQTRFENVNLYTSKRCVEPITEVEGFLLPTNDAALSGLLTTTLFVAICKAFSNSFASFSASSLPTRGGPHETMEHFSILFFTALLRPTWLGGTWDQDKR